MSFEIPHGLTDLLQEFTVGVLREKPPDLLQYAADYFNKLNDSRQGMGLGLSALSKGVHFEAQNGDGDTATTDSDDEEPFGMHQTKIKFILFSLNNHHALSLTLCNM
jgi:cAMP-dependent protein kinase regulator